MHLRVALFFVLISCCSAQLNQAAFTKCIQDVANSSLNGVPAEVAEPVRRRLQNLEKCDSTGCYYYETLQMINDARAANFYSFTKSFVDKTIRCSAHL